MGVFGSTKKNGKMSKQKKYYNDEIEILIDLDEIEPLKLPLRVLRKKTIDFKLSNLYKK